ncbi:HemK methyltransferase member 2 [Gaertneriomyces sp. JEL0708]|nr:HemK methyltransferase member 2 [Gaertneriomyces sp. JEL0708]
MSATTTAHHPTPDLSHLKAADWRQIYEPAQDTFLFLDALENDIDLLKQRRPTVCLEIGSGSGCVMTFLATLLGSGNALYLTTDVNPKAATATMQTGRRNGVPIDTLRSDLFPPWHKQWNRTVDVLLFNPPYVVTPSEEVGSQSIEAAWAGGVDGREVIDRVLPLVDNVLSKNGLFYMVVIRENKPEEIMDYMHNMGGFKCENVLSRKAGTERLSILRFMR